MNGTKQVVAPIDEEARAHQERTAKIRFKQNMVHGIGAATVFGLATGAFGALFDTAMTGVGAAEAVGAGTSLAQGAAALTMASGLAWAGIAALVVVGIGCLYLSSKYTSQLVNLEQTRHATQIAKGINGVGQGLDKPIAFPAQSNAQAAQNEIATNTEIQPSKPTLVVNNVANLGRTVAAIETSRGQA